MASGEGILARRGTWIEAPRASHVPKVKILDLKVGLSLSLSIHSSHALIFAQVAVTS